MFNALIFAALSVVPAYTNSNRFSGMVMTNIQSWAEAVEKEIEQAGSRVDTQVVTNIVDGIVASSNFVAYVEDVEGNKTAVRIGPKATDDWFPVITFGKYAFVNGYECVATNKYSHAEGYYTAAYGNYSHAEGSDTYAIGNYSHVEGSDTKAIGIFSHAEGKGTEAKGGNSHAEGLNTKAYGYNSHAEGYGTVAYGYNSHASGYYSISSNDGAVACGVTGLATNGNSFVWQGSDLDGEEDPLPYYGSHGHGTYNLNPVGGLRGLWIGETNMADHINAMVGDVKSDRITTANGLSTIYADGAWVTRTNATAGVAVTNALCTVATAQMMTNGITFAQLKSKPTKLAGYGITDAYTKTEADDQFLPTTWSENSASIFSGIAGQAGYGITAGCLVSVLGRSSDEYALSILVRTDKYTYWPKMIFYGGDSDWVAMERDVPNLAAVTATNAAEAVVAEVQDYALTNLTGADITLASGQIGNITMTANVSVTLDFSAAADSSGDCLLYVANTDGEADHYIVPMQTNDYRFVSSDLAKALTMKMSTTNLVSFTRLTQTAVLVSKVEVK